VFGSLVTDESICTFARSTSTFFLNSPELMKHTLEEAMAKGFLMENGKLGYRFSHNKVQQVAYSLLEDRNKAHLEIGRLLVKNARPATKSSSQGRGKVSFGTISESDITDFIGRQLFVAVDQMNRGKDLILDEDEVASLVRLIPSIATLFLLVLLRDDEILQCIIGNRRSMKRIYSFELLVVSTIFGKTSCRSNFGMFDNIIWDAT
jgi:hypothetical protein